MIEISESTLGHDLGRKRLDYARFGVGEYWIVDLLRRRVLTFREPFGDPATPETAWRHEGMHGEDESVTSTTLPAVTIRVGDILPRIV